MVTIDGTGFLGPISVTIGGNALRDVAIVSPSRLTGITVPGTAGTAHVTVSTSGGLATLPNGYRYAACSSSSSGGLRFDHTRGQELTSFANFDMPQGVITVEAWIYPRAGENSGFGFNGILAQWGTYSPVRWEVFLIFDGNATNFYVCFFKDWPSGSGGCSPSYPTNRWYHLAVTYDGGTIRFYFDGQQVGTASANGPIYPAAFGATFSVGGQAQQNDDHLTGSIDELRIWSIVRTADQIAEGMYRVPASSTPGLFALYTLDEGSAQSARDQAPGARHLTLGRNAGAESRDPTWIVTPPTCDRPARSLSFGMSCGAPPLMRTLSSNPPEVGGTVIARLQSAAVSSVGGLILSPIPNNSSTLPGGCEAYFDLSSTTSLSTLLVSGGGTWSSSFSVPLNPALSGLGLVVQAAMVEPVGAQIELSNALFWRMTY